LGITTESEIIEKIGYENFTELNTKIYSDGRIDTLEDISIAALFEWAFKSRFRNHRADYPTWLSRLYLNAVIPLILLGFFAGLLLSSFFFLAVLILH
jgi:hypothetical protein